MCSAPLAYNSILDAAESPYVVLAHQDVYLPANFFKRLFLAIATLNKLAPEWGVLGIIGKDTCGHVVGRVWSNGLQKEVGSCLEGVVPVVSIDELLIVIRRDSGLRFDEGLPGFHLYGTDIVLTALERGFGAYVTDAPVIHNSLPVRRLDASYEAAYRYMQRKWSRRLPLDTLIVSVTGTLWPLRRQRLRALKRKLLRVSYVSQRHLDPAERARELGYERKLP